MPSIEWNRSTWPEQFAAHASDESIYGYQWGDPNSRDMLVRVRDQFVLPYVHPERTALEILRTDTPLFQNLIESRRNRPEEWFHVQAGRIEIGNVPIPTRKVTAP